MLHAGFTNVDMWKHQMPMLSQQFRVITIDLPGHGKTVDDTTGLYPSAFITAVLDSLHLTKASIAGVSLGASCVMDYIIAHPERIEKAILVSSGIVGWHRADQPDSLVSQFINSFFTSFNGGDTTGAAEKFTKFWFDGPLRSAQQVNDSARRYIYESTLYNLRHHSFSGWPRFADTAVATRLSGIRLPVQLIDGDQDVPVITAANDHMMQNIPRARRTTIPGAGHMLNMEAPAEFNTIVLEFLQDKATIKK